MRLPLLPLVAIASAAALAACDAAAPTHTLAPSRAAQSRGSTVSEWIPIAVTLPNPCTGGEVVALTGRIHAVAHQTVDREGRVQTRINQNWAGVTGVGAPSGTEYVIAGSAHRVTYVAAPPSGEAGDMLKELTLFISKGPAPNALMRIYSLYRVDDQGNVQIVLEPTYRCVG